MCFRSCYISRQIEELMTWLIGSNSLGRKNLKGRWGGGEEGGGRRGGVKRKGLEGGEQRGGPTLIKQVTDLNSGLEGGSPTAFPLIMWLG